MILSLALAATLTTTTPPREHRRAMWVWKTDAIIQDATARDKFFTFLNAPKGDPNARISVIFFACNLTDPKFNKGLQSLVADAHKRSIRVDYLCGEADYAMPDHMADGIQQLDHVVSYNQGAGKRSQFDGIQYDVEPYSLPSWPADTLLSSYISFLNKCRTRIDDSKQKLAFGVAIPRWFDGADLHGLYKSVLNQVDYVAVMDYVSNPDQFIKDATNTVNYAGEKGKDAWLGAEVSELPEEKTATFFALGNAKLEETFSAANRAFDSAKGFAGVAVEWYDTYQTLKP